MSDEPVRAPLQPGGRLGAYEIRAQIGEGGMGEVYRAHDDRLRRDIALKILPPEAADAERRQRFAREAQAVAALNHPGIVTIHSIEQSGDIHFLTMELVDGQTLHGLIPGGGLPIDRLLTLAVPLADAVGAAHSQGIVHRDLKPANVMVTRDGRVKVMDFGLAKLSRPASLDASATTMAQLTQNGRIFGTVAYMSPEQAEGRDVDHRSDVFSLGVMLYELATGRRPFRGESHVAVLAAIVKDTPPPIATLKSGLPQEFSRLVRRCLAKDPAQRYQSVLDLRHDLEEIKEDLGSPDDGGRPGKQRRFPFWLTAAVGIALGAAALAAYLTLRPASVAPGHVVRSQWLLEGFSGYPAISNDGSMIAYKVGANPSNIVVRRADEFEGKVVAGSENGSYPLFSPDGQWIAFSDTPGERIRRVPVGGGTSSTLVTGRGGFFYGATWGRDDTIVFNSNGVLMRLPASGGSASPLTAIDASKGEIAHVRPQYLPDGRHLLFTVSLKDQSTPLFAVLDLGTGTYRTIGPGGLNGRYLTSGHLAFVREGTLFVVPFDLKTMSITGAEVPVVENVRSNIDGTADYAVSDDGQLVYVGSRPTSTTLAWVDRSGNTTVLPGPATQVWGTGRLSPDGRYVANGISDPSKNRDIWIYDVTGRRALERVTSGGVNDYPIWSSDSKRIVYSGIQDGTFGIYSAPMDRSAKPALVATTPYQNVMQFMTPDERTLVYAMTPAGGLPQLFVLARDVNGKAGEPTPLHDGGAIEREGRISPDGKRIVYTSTKPGGTFEVYLEGFPIAGARTRISHDGGLSPRWSADGQELYYLSGRRMMSVAIPPGDAALAAEPKELFTRSGLNSTFDVTRDANKFLIELSPNPTNTVATRLNLVTNWFQALAERAKPKK